MHRVILTSVVVSHSSMTWGPLYTIYSYSIQRNIRDGLTVMISACHCLITERARETGVRLPVSEFFFFSFFLSLPPFSVPRLLYCSRNITSIYQKQSLLSSAFSNRLTSMQSRKFSYYKPRSLTCTGSTALPLRLPVT